MAETIKPPAQEDRKLARWISSLSFPHCVTGALERSEGLALGSRIQIVATWRDEKIHCIDSKAK